MSNTLTITGNLVADPELRYTPSGKAVVNFTVADNHRKPQGQEWVDDGTTFVRAQAWGEHAENIAERLKKGQRVTVLGQLRQRDYETRDGDKRTVFELRVHEVAAAVHKFTPKQQSSGAAASGASGMSGADPWGSSRDDEPPF